MRKNNGWICTLVLTGFILIQSACAQNPPFTGQAYVNEEKQVEKTTVLFNNDQQLIPLSDLGELRIASIHFTYQYTTAFDSLLNKYASVQTYNGADYTAVKTLGELSFDT